jgi:hypothetical protein
MNTLSLLVLAGALASAQATPSAAPAAPATTAQAVEAAAKTVEQTASPEIVGQLVKELAITPGQAEGAAGSMFGLAKTRLKPEEFAKVAAAVPNMDGLLKAAPSAAADGKASATDMVSKMAGNAGGMASLAPSFSKLGLKPDTIVKLAPTMIKVMDTKGGAEVGKLLATALK